MLEVEKKIKELKEENKSLKIKVIIFGLFLLSQISMLLLEKFQNNILTTVGIILMAFGIGLISIVDLIMIKRNNKFINKYKTILNNGK
jgi:dolichol kinase